MVEIVRALATDPPLLLLDEPAVGLAPPARAELMKIIRRLVEEENIAVILIEHAIEFVMTVCDTLMVLNNGELIAEGLRRRSARTAKSSRPTWTLTHGSR